MFDFDQAYGKLDILPTLEQTGSKSRRSKQSGTT